MIEDIVESINSFLKNERIVYLRCIPEINDFTEKNTKTVIELMGRKKSIKLPVFDESFKDRTNTYFGVFLAQLFQEDLFVITWDIKKLLSYFKFHTSYRIHYDINFDKVYDLKLIEAFLGKKVEQPSTWSEALERATNVAENEQAKKIHRQIHLPLAFNVVPSMETFWLKYQETTRVYSSYEIEGQKHGRLSCHRAFSNCYLPHTLSEEDKRNLGSNAYENKFLSIDFKHMEVSVLQWLSKDKILGQLVESGRDLYSAMYELFSGKPCKSEESRSCIKEAFLPTIYGCGAETLAHQMNVSVEGAKLLGEEIRKYFKEALNWVEEYQRKSENGEVIYDYFGRPRCYKDSPWVARNAVIQGPAAIICLEKLIALYNVKIYDIVMSIHDGYVLMFRQDQSKRIPEVIQILESPSNMCEGLRLKAEWKIGFNLMDLTKEENV